MTSRHGTGSDSNCPEFRIRGLSSVAGFPPISELGSCEEDDFLEESVSEGEGSVWESGASPGSEYASPVFKQVRETGT
jgi:hypothetical protein